MKKYFKIIYRISFIIISAIGIFIHFDFNDGDYNAHEFSFFTVQSNIFCLIFMCVLLIKEFFGSNPQSKWFIYFKGMSLSSIVCTFLVYHFADGKIIFPSSGVGLFGLPIESIFAHYIVPFMYILDWIIFQPKGYFKKRHILTWMAFPLLYISCFFTRCHCNSPGEFMNVPKYPYFFLDFETLGLPTCFLYLLVLSVVFLSVNVLIVFSDRFMYHSEKHKKTDCHVSK